MGLRTVSWWGKGERDCTTRFPIAQHDYCLQSCVVCPRVGQFWFARLDGHHAPLTGQLLWTQLVQLQLDKDVSVVIKDFYCETSEAVTNS